MENAGASASVNAAGLCMGCMAPAAGGLFCPQCGWKYAAPAASILHLGPGTVLQNTYVVGRALGQGGFGITYLGWDLQLHRKVAIKEYFPQLVAARVAGAPTVAIATTRAREDYGHMDCRAFSTRDAFWRASATIPALCRYSTCLKPTRPDIW